MQDGLATPRRCRIRGDFVGARMGINICQNMIFSTATCCDLYNLEVVNIVQWYFCARDVAIYLAFSHILTRTREKSIRIQPRSKESHNTTFSSDQA